MRKIQLGKPGNLCKIALYGIYGDGQKEDCEQIDVEESFCSGQARKFYKGRTSRPERTYKTTLQRIVTKDIM